jgi:hypothetical protein
MTRHPGVVEGLHMPQTQTPIRYEIVVKGRLSERFDSAFAGLELEPRDGFTAISGSFTDQSHLHGVLDLIRDLGIDLVSVNELRA